MPPQHGTTPARPFPCSIHRAREIGSQREQPQGGEAPPPVSMLQGVTRRVRAVRLDSLASGVQIRARARPTQGCGHCAAYQHRGKDTNAHAEGRCRVPAATAPHGRHPYAAFRWHGCKARLHPLMVSSGERASVAPIAATLPSFPIPATKYQWYRYSESAGEVSK